MRVLVTGAAGFIGLAVVRHLVARGVDVRAARRSTSEVEPLGRLGAEEVIFDVRDAESTRRAVRGCTHVIHLAAARMKEGVSREEMERVNVSGTLNLARSAVAEGAGRFVFGSTVGCYGFLTRSVVDEKTPLRPNSPYRSTKARAERALRMLASERGLPVVVVRICSTVGPHARMWMPLMRSVAGGRFRLIGDGMNLIHTAHVSEVADALWRSTVRPEAAGEIFTIAGPEPVPFRTFVGSIASALGVPPPERGLSAAPVVAACRTASLIYRRTGVFVRRVHERELLVAGRTISLEKARSYLGFAPSWRSEDAVAEMIHSLSTELS